MSRCWSLLRAGARHNTRRSAVFIRPYASLTESIGASSSTPLEHYVEKLTSTISLNSIHSHYNTLVSKLKESERLGSFPTRGILDETQMHKILWLLAKSGRPSDIQRLHEILLDMPLVFGLEPTIETYSAIVRGLIHRGDIHATRRWLEKMPERPGHITPTLELYHIFLEACPEMDGCTFRFMRGVVGNMRNTGCKPTVETFKILVRASWNLAEKDGLRVRPVVIASLFEDMEKEGLSYDESFSELIFEEYAERNLPIYAEQIQSQYNDKFRNREPLKRSASSERELKLQQTVQMKGIKAAIALFKSWSPQKSPSMHDIRVLLRHSRRVSDLQLVEQEWNIKCSALVWTLLILNNTRAGKLEDAVTIYEASKEAGVVPDSAMVAPIIHLLCQSNFGPPREENIERALQIYRDLRASIPADEDVPDRTANDLENSGPDQDIYATLLRGLSSASTKTKNINAAKEIMDDMEARNYIPDDSFTVSAIIVLNMRQAQDAEEALQVYRRLKSSLDEKGYAAVLNAFCKLNFGRGIHIPSLKGYFEIVKDMRGAGLETTVQVYTILLKQLGKIATELQKSNDPNVDEIRNHLILTARRTHDLLTLDASLSPDAVLWNQMMDTYQRLGCFADAYRVWDLMYLTGRFDAASVSIILDACGYAGAYAVAKKQVVSRLNRDNYQFSLHNWNSWLECLCRLGRLDEALRALCIEMGEQGVKPTVESVRIVVKFARNYGNVGEALSRIEKYLPDVWPLLPSDIR